jgi:hypothetical protein
MLEHSEQLITYDNHQRMRYIPSKLTYHGVAAAVGKPGKFFHCFSFSIRLRILRDNKCFMFDAGESVHTRLGNVSSIAQNATQQLTRVGKLLFLKIKCDTFFEPMEETREQLSKWIRWNEGPLPET